MGATLALVGSITPAMADQWDKLTLLEITEPLEIPGRVLTANVPPAEPPAPIPVAPAVTLDPPELAVTKDPEPAAEIQVEEEAASAPVGEPALVAAEVQETQIFELPSTAGDSMTVLLAGVAMLGICSTP